MTNGEDITPQMQEWETLRSEYEYAIYCQNFHFANEIKRRMDALLEGIAPGVRETK